MKIVNGIVSSLKLSPNTAENVYTLMLEDRTLQTKNSMSLELYDKVAVSFSDEGLCSDIKICGTADKTDYKKLIDKHIKSIGIRENVRAADFDGLPYKNVIAKSMPKLVKAANALLKCFVSGAPIIVRFHNDGDGASGATALYRAMMDLQAKKFANDRSLMWHMNRSIAYTVESAYEDSMLFNNYKSIEKPLMLLTDFGTSPESTAAIEHISKECELLWIDHHLPYEGFNAGEKTQYINSWNFGGDSNVTAGLLTCIFAQIIDNIDVELLKQASLISDYSKYANLGNKEAYKTALVLDFLTSGKSRYDSQGATPKQIESIVNDKEHFAEVFGFAAKLLDEALNVGLNNIKSYRSNGVNVHVLDFGHIAKLGYSYPLPGRYSSKLQEHMEALNNGSTMTVIHYGSYISIRESRDIVAQVDLLGIIEKLKDSGDAISGGGHHEAASIKVYNKDLQRVLRLLLEELGVKIKD